MAEWTKEVPNEPGAYAVCTERRGKPRIIIVGQSWSRGRPYTLGVDPQLKLGKHWFFKLPSVPTPIQPPTAPTT